MMKSVLTILVLSLLIVSCNRKYVGDFDSNYVGEWHTADMLESNGEEVEVYFIINGSDSQYGFMCEVDCSVCNCQLLTSGKAKINSKGTKLFIGSGNGNKRVSLKINEAPHLNNDGDWECTIDDLRMIKD